VIIADANEVASDLEVYLRKAQHGETIVIAIRNEPVAELRPTTGSNSGPRPFGLCAGDFVVADDFDSPLADDILADFEGR
jgi:antitoxin (DNA-binding transcriptional repressor) of toxin-antitoxin stability system